MNLSIRNNGQLQKESGVFRTQSSIYDGAFSENS